MMAASDELKHLTCSICLEFFTEPKLLPCVHRFCESCLDKYIKTSTKDKDSGFLCPCCKTFTAAPDSRRMHSNWAALFKTDFVIKDMISTKLREQSEIKRPCRTHSDIKCDYYCFNCSQIMCLRCALASHGSCGQDKVMTIPEAAKLRKTSLEAAISKVSQMNGRKQLQDLLGEYHSRMDRIGSRLQEDIHNWGRDVRRLVKKLEDELLETLDKKYNVLKERVESEVVEVQEIKDQVHGRIDVATLKLLLSDADILLDNTVDDLIKSCHLNDLSHAEENMKRKCENLSDVGIHFQDLSTASMRLGNILMTEDFNDGNHFEEVLSE